MDGIGAQLMRKYVSQNAGVLEEEGGMDSMRGRLSVMLRVFGALGLVVAVVLLPYGLFAVGVTFRSPLMYGIFARGYAPAIVAVLSALLFVSGRRGVSNKRIQLTARSARLIGSAWAAADAQMR